MGRLNYGNKLPYKDFGKDDQLFARSGAFLSVVLVVGPVLLPILLFLGGASAALNGLLALPDPWPRRLRMLVVPLVAVLSFVPVFLLKGD